MEAQEFNKLLERISKGDKAAFTVLYNEYCGKMKWAAFSIIQDINYAEDISSEVFIKIWNGQHKYVKNPNAWIYKITKNAALNFYNKHIKETRNVPLESVIKSESVTISESESVCLMEFQSMLIDLSEKDRDIVIKKLFYSYTYPEIAAEMGLSVGVVHKYYKRSLEKLEKIFCKNREKKD